MNAIQNFIEQISKDGLSLPQFITLFATLIFLLWFYQIIKDIIKSLNHFAWKCLKKVLATTKNKIRNISKSNESQALLDLKNELAAVKNTVKDTQSEIKYLRHLIERGV